MTVREKPEQDLVAQLRQRVAELERAVQQKECETTSRIQAVPLGLFECDATGRITFVSPSLERISGFTAEEMIGTHIWDRIEQGPQRDALIQHLQHLVSDQPAPTPFLARKVRKDGGIYEARADWNYKRDAQGKVIGALCIISDITEQRRAEEQLHKSERTLRTVMDASPESILLIDGEGKILFANVTTARRLGFPAEELVGRIVYDLFPPEVATTRRRHVDTVMRTGEPIRFDDVRAGRYFETSIYPLCDDQGTVTAVTVLGIDRTGQKEVEAALRRARDELERRVEERTAELTTANQELQVIYDGMIDGLLVADLETKRFVRANGAICRLLGYTEEELLSMTVADIHPAEIVPLVFEKFRTQCQGQRLHTECRPMLRKDGTVFFADISNTGISYHGRPCILGLFRDITDRKAAQEALRQSEERYRRLLEASPDAVVMAELDATVLFASRQTWTLLGIPDSEKLVGQNVLDYVIEEDRPRLADSIARLAETGLPRRTEYTAFRRDGTRIATEVSSALIRDAQGLPTAVMAMIRDVTERKRAEEHLRKEHRTLKHLLQSSDHERQVIAYEIHDGLAQQLAGAIMQFQGYHHQKEKNPALAAKAYDAGLTMLQQGHFEARRLIAGVRPPILDESGVLAAIVHLVNEQRLRNGPKIEFRSKVSFDRLVPILENAIYRIVQEGLTNACQHSKSEKVRVSLVQRDERVQIVIRDWGTGFPTKMVHENRYGIEGIRQRVRLLGGRCRIQSRMGEGTRIAIELPILVRG